MSDSLRGLLERHVEAGTVPGAVGLVGPPDGEPAAVGSASVGGAPLAVDAIFRIQSMTKAVTTVAALRLVEAGRLALDDSVERWLPELADRRVLVRPDGPLEDTVPADRSITVRHLLTNTSGYGMQLTPSPLADAMEANGTAAGSEPPPYGADEWLARLAELPLAFAPGDGWRYHHGFSVLGILLSRVAGRPLPDHLADDLFRPLGMVDTGFWVPESQLDRLPAAYRHEDGRLVETEPAAGGPYAGPATVDVSHGELVSTAADYLRFLRLLVNGGTLDGRRFLSTELTAEIGRDQVPDRVKTADSFFPGFWAQTGWGYGVAILSRPEHPGRYGWSGGQGTDFYVDPDGTVGLLLTQVELGPALGPLLEEFQALA